MLKAGWEPLVKGAMLRFFRRKYIFLALGVIALLVLGAAAGLFVYIQSPAFEATARRYAVREIARRTGATVELQEFHWNMWRQRFQLEHLTLRGLEPATDLPLAVFPTIEVGINFRSLFQHKVNLFELTLTNPAFHIVIDPRGKTNFPSPPGHDQKPLDVEVAIENFRI